MKTIGSNSEHAEARTRDLLRVYFGYLENCKHINMNDVFKRIVDMPASRFWVSSARATVAVAAIMRGDKLLYMRPNKREMFFEIHRRALEHRDKHPDWSLSRLVQCAVRSRAPKFYLSPGSARALILKGRKRWFAERKKRYSLSY